MGRPRLSIDAPKRKFLPQLPAYPASNKYPSSVAPLATKDAGALTTVKVIPKAWFIRGLVESVRAKDRAYSMPTPEPDGESVTESIGVDPKSCRLTFMEYPHPAWRYCASNAVSSRSGKLEFGYNQA